MKNSFLASLIIICFFTSCSTLNPTHFENGKPVLDPVKFFGGHTHSYGVLESPGGKPTEQITTTTTGVYANGILSIEQDLHPEKGKANHRSWKLKQIDAHHVESTANDIAGTARGELYGNYFTWTFRLKIANKGLVRHVRMHQEMYLMPDGRTLLIRSIIRKFGIIVKEISEQFVKDD